MDTQPAMGARARVWLAACLVLSLLGATPGGALAQATIVCAPPVPPGSLVAATSTPAGVVDESATFPEEGGELTIFAAASLTGPFDRIIADLEAAHPGLDIAEPNYAGSQALVTQLSEGADADVFASASGRQMAVAVENGVIAGAPVDFARNRLALVVPAGNPAGIDGVEDLASDDVKLVLALPEAPVGQYARETICAAGRDTTTYGDGFVEAVAGNVVSEEDNVKAVLAKVQLGEADAGIVYTTDVTEEVAGDVTLIEIPSEVNVVATYPIAPVEGGDEALAAAFIAYVLGPEGQATLASFGFETRPGV